MTLSRNVGISTPPNPVVDLAALPVENLSAARR
jgi:hypothetical protein